MSKGLQPTDTPRLFFDISGLVNYIGRIDRYSGIQRVVVTMIVELAKLVGPDLIYLSWCDKKRGDTYCVAFSELGPDTFSSPANMRRIFRPVSARRDQLPALKKYRRKPFKYYIQRTWLDLQAALGRDRRFRKYNMTAKLWRDTRKASSSVKSVKIETLDFDAVIQSGDRLVLLDTSWQPEQTSVFAAAKQSGMHVYSMVYDLIPILHPETCEGSVPAYFYDWLIKSTEYTDHYMAISHSACSDLNDFLSTHDMEKPTRVVPLAQAPLPISPVLQRALQDEGPLSSHVAVEMYPHFKDLAWVDDTVRQALSTPYIMCVGTIEARKNVWRIAMAWKMLLDMGHQDLPKLIFAGRRGWLRQDFEDLLAATGNIYGYVQVIEGPSDEDLDVLYRNCCFTIMASRYEGWGLPVGEALAYGKTAVVANNSALPEVGGDLVEYCDAQSVASIADAVKTLLDPSYRSALEARIAATDLRVWKDVAQDLLSALHTSDHPPT